MENRCRLHQPDEDPETRWKRVKRVLWRLIVLDLQFELFLLTCGLGLAAWLWVWRVILRWFGQ